MFIDIWSLFAMESEVAALHDFSQQFPSFLFVWLTYIIMCRHCKHLMQYPHHRIPHSPMLVSYKRQKTMPISISDTNRQRLFVIYCDLQNLLIKREQRKLAYYAERKKGRMKSKFKVNLFCHYPQTSPLMPLQTSLCPGFHILFTFLIYGFSRRILAV